MASWKGTMCLAALALLAFVCHAATVSNADDDRTTSHAVSLEANGDDTASIPDFDGDGTIGFGDFVKFAAKFGLRHGDVGYDAQFDLNDDAEIGFADFLIFAENFGKEVTAPGAGVTTKMYWTAHGTHKIQRSNLDGSGVEDLITGLDWPLGIALEFAPVEAGKGSAVPASASENTLTPGQSFTLPVTVRNQETGKATATSFQQ